MKSSLLNMFYLIFGLILQLIPNAGTCLGAEYVSVMCYNVENLFDTTHDSGKNDWEFLPKNTPDKMENCALIEESWYRRRCVYGDWTADRLNLKLDQIKSAVTKGNELPDILGVVEIENHTAASLLSEKLGYDDFVITKSPDERGVDVAVFYKKSSTLNMIEAKEYRLKGAPFDDNPSRNILSVDFRLFDDYIVSIVLVHFPSQASPAAYRATAAENVKEVLEKKMKDNQKVHLIVMGDFNVDDSDVPNAVDDILVKEKLFYDVHTLKIEKKGKELSEGSYFYIREKAWRRFDRFLISQNLTDNSGIDVDIESYKIKNQRFLSVPYTKGKTTIFIPNRYNFLSFTKSEAGFSDHFPIMVSIKKVN